MSLIAALVLAQTPNAVLVRDGTPNAVIDLPDATWPSERYAAVQLQSTLHQMSGATIPIGGNAPVHIRLETGQGMGTEEFDLQCDGKNITIRGGGLRGTMYGCFALLEEVLGCRWYNLRRSFIPSRQTVDVPVVHLHEKPAFEYREASFWEAQDGRWACFNRMNGSDQHLTTEMGGRVIYGRFVHTAAELVPPSIYFATHPEYFALRDGKRIPDQLELTNPEILPIAIATVEKWIADNPQATIFSVSQNDNLADSQSPATKAIEDLEGAPSGLYLRFVNAIAAEVAPKHPGVLIDTLAYEWTEDPPRLTKPLPNVRIRLAPIAADFGHAFDQSPANAKPYANLKAWHQITNQLYIWHYATDFANYIQPVPDLDEIGGDIPLFAKNGVVGIYYEGDYAEGGGGEMAGLKSYLIAKLLWNPDQPARPIIEDYVKGVYGAAAPFILQWLDAEHASVRKGMTASIFDAPTAPYLPDDLIPQGVTLFDQAEAAAKDTPAEDEVQRARLALEYIQLARLKQGTPEYTALAAKVAAKIHKYGITQYKEGGPISEYLKSIGQS